MIWDNLIRAITAYIGYNNNDLAWRAEIEHYRVQYSALFGDAESGAQLATMVDERSKYLASRSLYTSRWILDTLAGEVKRRLMYGVSADDAITWLDGIQDVSQLIDAREENLTSWRR